MTELPRVLIVDDEPFNVDILEQRLEPLGYQLISATDGKQALDQLSADFPGIVVTDVRMPRMDDRKSALTRSSTRLGELRYAETIEFGMNRDAFLLKIATERALFEPIGLANSALTPEDSRRFLKDLHEVLAIIDTVAEAIVGQCEISQSGDAPHVCNG